MLHVTVRPKSADEIAAVLSMAPFDTSGVEVVSTVLGEASLDAFAAAVQSFRSEYDDVVVVGDPVRRDVMEAAASDPRFDGVPLWRTVRESSFRVRCHGDHVERVVAGAPVVSWARVRC